MNDGQRRVNSPIIDDLFTMKPVIFGPDGTGMCVRMNADRATCGTFLFHFLSFSSLREASRCETVTVDGPTGEVIRPHALLTTTDQRNATKNRDIDTIAIWGFSFLSRHGMGFFSRSTGFTRTRLNHTLQLRQAALHTAHRFVCRRRRHPETRTRWIPFMSSAGK